MSDREIYDIDQEVIFACCFCGDILDEDDPEWVGLSIYNKDTGDPGQMWFCHESCLRERMLPLYGEARP